MSNENSFSKAYVDQVIFERDLLQAEVNRLTAKVERLTEALDRDLGSWDQVDALKKQLADSDLAFNHANDVVGKLEADNQRLHENYVELECRYEALARPWRD